MDAVTVVQNLVDPAGGDEKLRLDLLHEDVTLRVWRWDGAISGRGRERVAGWFRAEWESWPDPSLEVFPPADASPSAVQFRIYATEDGRYVEHNRGIFLGCKDNLIHGIDLYCAEPVFSAHRKGYIAPPTLTDEEVGAFLEEMWHGWDVREWMPPNRWRYDNRRIFRAGSGDPHPGSNFVGGSRWTADEADSRIDEILAGHERQGTGFVWWVMPFDTPSDLCERLEKHGFMLAGQNARMARLGLNDLSNIPTNDQLLIQRLDGADDPGFDDFLHIEAACFHLSPEQAGDERRALVERINDAEARKHNLYCVAYLDGEPAGMAALSYQFGRAYLNGAATLPEYRGHRVYSTLLSHRLAVAREAGYHLAAIDAGPMSRRVVEKYGFKEYGTVKVYAWMPEMDPEVIKSLVPDE